MIFKKTMLALIALAPVAPLTAQEPNPPQRSPEDRRPERTDRVRHGGPERRGPRPPAWNEMSEAERKDVTKFMEEHFPRLVVEIDRLKESKPPQYERRMNRLAPEMRRLMELNERDPRHATVLIRERQVGLQMQQMARDYHSAADDDEKARIRKSVRELAAQEFDNRLERRNMEVRQLETKLAELKGRLSEMESVRSEMLDRRTREILERKPKRDGDESQEPADEGKPRKRGPKNTD